MPSNTIPPKGRPHLTIVKSLNVGDVSMNVNTKGDFSVSTNAETVKIINKRPRVKPLPVEGALTEGHKAEFAALIKQWVDLAKPKFPRKTEQQLFSGIRARLNKKATSAGRFGVTSVHAYPECDFEKGKKFLKQEIAILYGSATVRKQAPNFINACMGAIHKRCKELGVSDETRKAYQLARFGKDSLANFNQMELEEMLQYVKQPNPSFGVERVKAPDTQQNREKALAMLLGSLRVKHAWFAIPEPLPFDKVEIRQMLEDQDIRLFEVLSESQFNRFWSTQKLCKLKRGNKPRS